MKNSREEDVVCSYRKWLLIESVGVSFVQRPLQQNRRRWLTDTSSYLLTLIFGHNQRQPAEVQEEEEMNRFLVSGSCWKRNEMKAKTTVELDKGYFRRAGREAQRDRVVDGEERKHKSKEYNRKKCGHILRFYEQTKWTDFCG